MYFFKMNYAINMFVSRKKVTFNVKKNKLKYILFILKFSSLHET